MKVRWTSESFRLRITPEELADLEAGKPISTGLRLPGSRAVVWEVRVETGSEDSALFADVAGEVRLRLTTADVSRLAQPTEEGIYFRPSGDFFYYIEKDFPCLHPRAAEAMEPTFSTFAPPPDFAERKA